MVQNCRFSTKYFKNLGLLKLMMQRITEKHQYRPLLFEGYMYVKKIDLFHESFPTPLDPLSFLSWERMTMTPAQQRKFNGLFSSWENETSSPEILKIRPFFPAISVDLTDLNYHGHNIKGFFQNHYWTIDSLLYLQKFVSVFKNKHGQNEQMCLAHISHLVFHLLLSSKEFMIV